MFYAHGGLNSPDDAAIRTAAMLDGFARNGVYPYSVFYDTGLARTLQDIIVGKTRELRERTGGFGDFWDALVERLVGPVGKSLWREMKRDARVPFEPQRDGEAAPLGLLREARLLAHHPGVAPGAVQHEHERQRVTRRARQVQQVAARAAAAVLAVGAELLLELGPLVGVRPEVAHRDALRVAALDALVHLAPRVAMEGVALDHRGADALAPEDVLEHARDGRRAGAARAGDDDDRVLPRHAAVVFVGAQALGWMNSERVLNSCQDTFSQASAW